MQKDSYYSPNFDKKKRSKNSIKIIVIHYTGMQSKVAAFIRLSDPKYKVSCHYLIDEQGNIEKIVPEEFSAWHAGKSAWKNYKFLNTNEFLEVLNSKLKKSVILQE